MKIDRNKYCPKLTSFLPSPHRWAVKMVKVGRSKKQPYFYKKRDGTYEAAIVCRECGDERKKTLTEEEAGYFRGKYHL